MGLFSFELSFFLFMLIMCILQVVLCEPALCLKSSLTSRTCGYDGLAVCGVGTVTGSEYAVNVGAGRTVLSLDVASLATLNGRTEYVCVGLVTDGEEEAVDGDVVMLLVSLTLALNDVSTLYAVLTEEPLGIVLIENLNLLVVLHALLHNV